MVQKFLQEYKDIPPIGNILRKDYKDYCFRIHNLSNNKRYPENDEDNNTISILYNQIIDIICKSNTILGFISLYDFDVNELENLWLQKLNLTFLKEFNIKGVIISESPNLEEDALKMKKYWEELSKK